MSQGAAPGEQVVVEGQAQLRPGAQASATKPAPSGLADALRVRRASQRGARRAWRARARRARSRDGVSEPFIRRPVATTLLMVGLLLAGSWRFTQLPVSALPQVDYPTIVVSTFLPGAQRRHDGVGGDDAARAPVRADAVALADDERLELRQLADHAAVHPRPQHRRRRAGRAGGDQRRVEPAPRARCRRRRRTARATPPTRRSSRSRSAPTTLPLDQVDDYADSILAQKISQVSGVGLVTLNGGQKPAVRVQVDPVALARHRAHASRTCAAALVAANVNQPKGNIDGPRQDYTLATNDQLYKADGVQAARHRLRERLAGAPARRRERRSTASRTRSSPAGPNDEARHHPQRPAPARRQRHPGRRPREGAAAAAAGVAAAGHRGRRS